MRLEDATTADLRWLPHAIRIASLGNGRSKHGAVLYRSGRLLRVARNRSRVRDEWVLDRPRETCSVHAEDAATRGLDCRGAVVLVVRVNRAGVLRPSAPCPSCWSVLSAAGVKRVVHS